MYIYIYMYIYIICIRRNNSYKAIYQLDLDLGLTVTLKRSLAEIGEEIENQTKRLNLTIIQQFTIHQKSGKEEGSKYEIEKDGKRKRGERWRWRWEADQKKKKKKERRAGETNECYDIIVYDKWVIMRIILYLFLGVNQVSTEESHQSVHSDSCLYIHP